MNVVVEIRSIPESQLLDAPGLVRALRSVYPADAVVQDGRRGSRRWRVESADAAAHSVRVQLNSSRTRLMIDASYRQQLPIAVALRAEMPEHGPRIIAIQDRLGFLDLEWQVVPDETGFHSPWRPFDEFPEPWRGDDAAPLQHPGITAMVRHLGDPHDGRADAAVARGEARMARGMLEAGFEVTEF